MQRRGTSRQYRVLCTRIQSPPFPKLGWSPCVAFTFRDACSRGRAVARHPSPPRQRRSAVPGVVQVVPWRGRARHARGEHPARGPAGRSEGLQGERSEEHTSELQSQSNLVCRLLLEKKKNRK